MCVLEKEVVVCMCGGGGGEQMEDGVFMKWGRGSNNGSLF